MSETLSVSALLGSLMVMMSGPLGLSSMLPYFVFVQKLISRLVY